MGSDLSEGERNGGELLLMVELLERRFGGGFGLEKG